MSEPPGGELERLERQVAEALHEVRHLELALKNSRLIGMAIGIVVERLRVGHDDALQLLKAISQCDNKKLREVASDIVFSGVIPTPGPGD